MPKRTPYFGVPFYRPIILISIHYLHVQHTDHSSHYRVQRTDSSLIYNQKIPSYVSPPPPLNHMQFSSLGNMCQRQCISGCTLTSNRTDVIFM
jgi:hypothetical protein